MSAHSLSDEATLATAISKLAKRGLSSEEHNKKVTRWSHVEMKEIPTVYIQKSVRRQHNLHPLRLFKLNGATLSI